MKRILEAAVACGLHEMAGDSVAKTPEFEEVHLGLVESCSNAMHVWHEHLKSCLNCKESE